MARPLVSVIVPTYKRRDLLREALQSVLAQTVSDIEVLVVEDGSDTAADVVRGMDPRVRYLWQSNSGVSVARNTGAAQAHADWLAFLDDDDSWVPQKLERQLELARRTEAFDVIHTDYTVLVNGTLRPGPRLSSRDRVPSGTVARDLFLDNFVVTSSVMLKRTVFDRTGGFNPTYAIVQDYELWLRISRGHQIGYLNEPLIVYRDHESLSSRDERIAGERAAALTAFAAAHPEIWNEYGAETVRKRLAEAHWQAGYAHYLADSFPEASRHFFRAWRWKQRRFKAAVYGVACAMGATPVRTLRKILQLKR